MPRWIFNRFFIAGFEFVLSILFGFSTAQFRRFWQPLLHSFLISSLSRPDVVPKVCFSWVSMQSRLPASQSWKGWVWFSVFGLSNGFISACVRMPTCFQYGSGCRFRGTCFVFMFCSVFFIWYRLLWSLFSFVVFVSCLLQVVAQGLVSLPFSC